VGPDHAKRDFDYVLIARRPALTLEFAALVSELTKAFARVHRAPTRVR
jgi:RNase P protein component